MTNSKMSQLIIPLEIHKSVLNQLIKKDFKPIDMLSNQSIEDIELDGKENEVVVILDMKGRLSGKVRATFTPQFDLPNQKIEITKLSANLLDTGFLSKGLNWMMDSFLKDNLQTKVQEILDEQLAKLFDQYVNSKQLLQLPNNLKADLLIKKVNLLDFNFSEEKLHIELEIHGFISLLSTAK